MYFLVDAALIVLLVITIAASVKFGFSRNFVFGIIRFLIALAGGAGIAAGVYLLFDKLGWLESMTSTVAKIFGDNSTLAYFITDEKVALIGKIIAFLPLGIILWIAGYVFLYWFVAFLMRLLFFPLFKSRKKKGGKLKIADNVLGLVFNLAIYLGVVAVVFSGVHALNEGDRYKRVLGGDNPSFGQTLVNNIAEPVLYTLNENFTASPIGYYVYNYNPLNKTVSGIINK